MTQPAVLPNLHSAWWEAVKRAELDKQTEVIMGAAVVTSTKGMALWMKLMGASDLPGAAEVMAEWAKHEREMPKDIFAVGLGNKPISIYLLGEMPIHSCGQSVSAPRIKAGARLNAHGELRAKRQRSAREAIYRHCLIQPASP